MLLTPLVSLLVIRQTSAAVWGEFVAWLILVQLAAHVVGWGNDAYLLRAFSRNPAHLAEAWQSSLQTRLLLFVPLAVLCALLYPHTAVWLILLALGLVLHQSCAVLVTYRRDFFWAAGVELAGLGVLVTAVVYTGKSMTAAWLLRLFTLTMLSKAALLLLRYRAMVGGKHGRVDRRYFQLALPFFLLGFGGLLASRLDLYLVTLYFPPAEVGTYQVFSTFLLYIQALAGFMLLPFVKTIYRLPHATIQRVARSLLALGCLLVPAAMFFLFFLLTHLYAIFLPPLFFWLGGLAALPIFYFSPIIYALYKVEKQTTVLLVNVGGIGTAFALNLWLLPRIGLIGAVVAMLVMKWLTLFVYHWASRRLLA